MTTPTGGLDDLGRSFSGRLLTDPDDMAPHLSDWRGMWTGSAIAVAEPDDTAGVAAIVKWCAANRVAIVPQGGNTGLSGGATPDASGNALVLSLRRMNRIRAVDIANNTITAEAGCVLQTVQEAARTADRLFPLSLAAEGSCTIGGNLATNAGGTGVLRYGTTRELCLGLEVVTAEGEVWDGLRGLRKDNTGYALRDLYVGSEGTLGIITAAVLKLYPLPAGRCVAIAAVASVDGAIDLLHRAQAALPGDLAAFELFSNRCLDIVCGHRPGVVRPVEAVSDWYCLVEAGSPEGPEAASAALTQLLETAFERNLVQDAAISASEAQAAALWALREEISEAQSTLGKTIKHDIALPISAIPGFIAEAEAALRARFPQVMTGVFGHVGDGNLHFNVLPAAPEFSGAMPGLTGPINALVHDLVTRMGGSISAEHGLGVLRRDEAARYKPAVEIDLQRRIKAALDPYNLMNPGKVLPDFSETANGLQKSH